jgi:hypothetical protein
MALTRSKDRKVANAVSPNGKTPTIANTFGLPAGKSYSCPGATTVCEGVCYAGKLEKVYKGVKNVLLNNWEQLKDADYLTMYNLLDEMIVSFNADCDKRNAEKLFRIHWDGDFFNETYVLAWKDVILKHADVQFWAYTRSEFAIEPLTGIANLSLYFSTDSANRSLGIRLKKKHDVKLAYLATNFAEGKADFKEIQDKPAAMCPENRKQIKLISEKGSACVSCSLCVFNKADILFSATKK